MKKGNIPTLEEIAHDYGNMVSSICRRMLNNDEEARDAAQEVWLQVVKSFHLFRGDSMISTWIYSVARRVVMKYAKEKQHYSTRFLRNKFQEERIRLPELNQPEKTLWMKETCDRCLTGILHCLDAESRLAYIFRNIADLSYSDIANILGKNEAAVRKITSRSRRKLRNFLQEECYLYNPKGACKCRLKEIVIEVNLPEEYRKVRKIVSRVNLFQEAEKVMPGRNYWEEML